MRSQKKANTKRHVNTSSGYVWAARWTETFEATALFTGEALKAGARLNRSQEFQDVEVAPGLISGRIETRGENHTAQLGVRVLQDAAWQTLGETLLNEPANAVAVLLGELPESLSEVAGPEADSAGARVDEVSLLPDSQDLHPDCSCGDWNGLCAHAAALLYASARLIEADPFVLTTVRGKGRYELKTIVESARSNSGPDSNSASTASSALSGYPRGEDPGISGADAYRRRAQPLPSARRLPLTVGEPLAVTVPPPVDSGVTVDDIQRLISVASQDAMQRLRLED